jgi:hypothetical protein
LARITITLIIFILGNKYPIFFCEIIEIILSWYYSIRIYKNECLLTSYSLTNDGQVYSAVMKRRANLLVRKLPRKKRPFSLPLEVLIFWHSSFQENTVKLKNRFILKIDLLI